MTDRTETTLFRLGDFVSHSGIPMHWKIECDALTDRDWECLAYLAAQLLPAFGSVEGVPVGGIKFANALQQYVTVGPHLIADDVTSTGQSLEQARNGRQAIGVAAFSRGACPAWVIPIFTWSGFLSPMDEPAQT